MDNFWWEDSSCLAPEDNYNAVAVICQYDIDVASTTTTSAASTTSRIPESTTVTLTTAVTTTTVTPGNSCPSGWQEFDSHCYLVVKSYLTWENAEKNCKSKGGHLASVHSAAERNFIHSLAPGNYLWIGGSDSHFEVGFSIYIYS